MEEQVAGEWFVSETPYGPLVHARLRPAQENSGKLVTVVRQRARQIALEEGRGLVIIDGPPGIGCPVISSISGVDLAVLVAEPTVAGAHDLERILATAHHFQVKAVVVINKYDLSPGGTAAIEEFCHTRNIPVVGKVPFDPRVTEAMVKGIPVSAYGDGALEKSLREIWKQVKRLI